MLLFCKVGVSLKAKAEEIGKLEEAVWTSISDRRQPGIAV